MYLNKVTIIGNLTRDPELKALPTGTKVASISMATNRTWKDAQGQKKEDVEYHNVVAFGKQAEVIAQYCKKGAQLLVQGRIQTRSWDATDGTKKYRTEIVLEEFQFGSKPSGVSETRAEKEDRGVDTDETQKKSDLDNIEYPEEEINLEDIPF